MKVMTFLRRPRGRAVAAFPPVFRKILGLLRHSIRRVEERFRNRSARLPRISHCARERRTEGPRKTSDQRRRRPKDRLSRFHRALVARPEEQTHMTTAIATNET